MENILKLFSLTTQDGVMILIATALFFFLWQLLSSQLFAPYVQLTTTRESMTIGASAQADQINHEADVLFNEIEAALRDARIQAMTKKLDILATARADAQQSLEQAEKEAADYLKSSRRELDTVIQDIKTRTFDRADALADDVVARLRQPEQFQSQPG